MSHLILVFGPNHLTLIPKFN